MDKKAEVPGGATLWARQTIDSEIFYEKPDKWFKIWFYLVNRVSHKDTGKYKRGETFLQYEWVCERTGASIDQVKKCIGWLRGMGMVSTRRSTRGVWVEVCKYSHFQRLDNYYYGIKAPDVAPEKHQRSTREALRYNKNDKNDKNDNITLQADACETEQITELITLFRDSVNPSINYGNKTTRKACVDLIKKFGFEEVKRGISAAVSVQGEKFAPVITTPYQFQQKLGAIKIYFDRQSKNNIQSL